MNYVTDLRKVRDHYRFSRAADADMALWVLHEKCFGTHRDADIEQLYASDPTMLRLRAKNVMAPLAGLSYPRLALALKDAKSDLAALVACGAFESLIRETGRARHVEAEDLFEVIDQLPNHGKITELRKGRWHAFRQVRNALFHKGTDPTSKELDDLVKELLQLEEDLRDSKSHGPRKTRQ